MENNSTLEELANNLTTYGVVQTTKLFSNGEKSINVNIMANTLEQYNRMVR